MADTADESTPLAETALNETQSQEREALSQQERRMEISEPAHASVPEAEIADSTAMPSAGDAPTRQIQVGEMRPLPFVDEKKMRLNVPLYEEVTSLDLTPDGCYVLAGCASGAVLLFDVTNSKRVEEIGRIRAKGLHTTVRVTVCVSQDSRFVFAGVLRGSVELLAIDISRLPSWDDERRSGSLAKLLVPYTHADAKLKGFGAVTRTKQDHPEHGPEYKLLCGRSIRNIHIWRFCPDSPTKPHWELLFDVPSNGNTIEVVGFQNDTHAFSKSKHQPLRLWNLENSSDPARGNKLEYVDTPNTQDMYVVSGEFAFGGMYEFSVVNLDGTGWVNRTEMALPAPADESDAGSGGSRKRRVCREISGVVCSQDGKHIIAACTDGSLVYYNGRTCTTPILLPDMEVRESYAIISRVGRNGVVTVAAVVPSEYEDEFHLRVSALSGILGDKRLQDSEDYIPAWPEVYRCVTPVIVPSSVVEEKAQVEQEEVDAATAEKEAPAELEKASPPSTAKKEAKRSVGRPRYQTPASRPSSTQARAKITPSAEARVLATPNRRAADVGGEQNKAYKRARTETPQVPTTLPLNTSPIIDDERSSPRQDLDLESIDSAELIAAEPLVEVPPAPQVRKMEFSDAVQKAPPIPAVFEQFLQLRDEYWEAASRQAARDRSTGTSFPQRFTIEHERVRTSFYEAVERLALEKIMATSSPQHGFQHAFSILFQDFKKQSHASMTWSPRTAQRSSFPDVVHRFSQTIHDMLRRQNAEMRAATGVLALGQNSLRLATDRRIDFEGRKQMIEHGRQFLDATDRLIEAAGAAGHAPAEAASAVTC